MGLLRGIGRGAGWAGRRVAMRSRWLARRLWLIAAAESAFVAHRHWRRLEPDERDRLLKLARKSKGRPSRNLSASERRDAGLLLDKLGHIELVGDVASIVLPFRPLSRLATRIFAGPQRERQAVRAELEAGPTPPADRARPRESEQEAGSPA